VSENLVDPGYIASREWHRTDLALLDSTGAPVALIEAKAMASFDVPSPATMAKFMGYLRADQAKARRLAVEGTEILILLIVAHISDSVPEPLMPVIKYARTINSSLKKRTSDE
jgi:hypothetical protein